MTRTEIQIRFADIDGLGHVNNVNLQHFFDVGKMDFYVSEMRLPMMPTGGEIFPITASTHTDYFAQTRASERIVVETSLEKVGTKSMTLFQRIVSTDEYGVVIEEKAVSRSVMVAFDFGRQETVEVPKKWINAPVRL